MKRTGILMAGLLAGTALTEAWAQEVAPLAEENVENSEDHAPVDASQEAPPSQSPAQQPPVVEFRDAEGNPLPADIQAELREHFRNNPRPAAETQAQPPGQPGEIVVSRQRERGSIIGDTPPERTFNQLDIRAYGAATIEELLDAVGPQVASNRGRDDGAPVTLLNGRRVSNFSEIARIPSEAIERMDVFPEEVALQYGYRADQKVVNIVTFERFNSQFGQLDYLIPTEGGWANAIAKADHFEIRGDTRFSLGVNYNRSGSLLESERNIVQPAQAPKLGHFRTLLPQAERAELTGLIGRPLAQEISATLNGRFELNRSESLLGLDGERTLRRDVDGYSLRLGTTFNGNLDRWLWNVTGNYNRADTEIETDVPESGGPRDQARSIDALLDATVLLSGPIVDLPAGPLLASISGGLETRDFESSSLRGGIGQQTNLSRRRGSVQFNVDVPLLDPADGDFSPLGRFSLNANLALEDLSDAGSLHTFGYGLIWSPIEAINFIASATREEGAPTLQQLGGPILETPNVGTFDFARRMVVDITRVGGGNPDLLTDDRNVVRLGLNVAPIKRTDFTVSVDYVATRIEDPIASFPIALPTIETAFPDRFTRDSDGRLARIDGRPVNFARSEQKQLRWGVNFTRPLGPVPPGLGSGTARTFSSPEEAKRAFPNATFIVAEPGSALARRAENTRSRIFASLYHNWCLQDEIIVREGLPALDLIDGGAVDFTGGRRRHEIEFQAGLFQRGLGARLTGAWRSGTDVNGLGGAADELSFSDLATVNLNLFANLAERFGGTDAPGWLQGTRATIGINNLFNARQTVRDQQGEIPISYQPAYLDPLGRTLSFSLRKMF